jgi:pimeloyl-ACP methyl ester carboxylesterase
MFRRDFAQAGSLRIHYRTAGSGPPVVMLHPSPLSSQAVLPVAAAIAGRCEVFALDTPGYGLSDPLPQQPHSLDPFLPPLERALDALGIERCCLYGAATGAQIAVEFAARHPQRVGLLVMDTAGHIPAQECRRLVDGYFPDVRPHADGGHLLTLWGLVRDLGVFFPWNDTRQASRIARDLMPAAAMQGMLLDYLRAGTCYDWAYRPAFHNERAERLRRCTVPGILTRWPSSIALAITDALIAEGLPENFRVLKLGPSMTDRAEGIAAAIAASWHGAPAAPVPGIATQTGAFSSHLLDAGAMQLHARIAASPGGRPVVALHRAGGSARLMESLLAPLTTSRPVVAIDLPGHGDSDAPGAADHDLAGPVRRALDGLSLAGADLVGDGLGAMVGARLKAAEPARFGRQVAIDRNVPGATAAPWPALTPRLDGSHLLEAWFMLRDRRLWAPWHERMATAIRGGEPDLAPESLHAELVELFKCGERFADFAIAEADTDLRALLGTHNRPALLLQEAIGDSCAAARPGCLEQASLPRHPVAACAVIRQWLDSGSGRTT